MLVCCVVACVVEDQTARSTSFPVPAVHPSDSHLRDVDCARRALDTVNTSAS